LRVDQPLTTRSRRLLLLTTTTTAALAALATGCGSSDSPTSGEASGYPVTVSTCGHEATFDEAPKRVVTTDVNMVEDMIALGLGDRVIGTFAVDDDTHKIADEYRDAWNELDHASPDYPELEPLVALNPDFVFSGWAWGLSESKNLTPDNLDSKGIKTYILSESCDWGPGGATSTTQATLDSTTYADLTNLGKIFGVEAKAEQVVDDMKAKIADVENRVEGAAPKKVFLYDAGDAAPFTVGGNSIPSLLIEHAGGANILGEEKSSWMEGSWEKVVAAQPDCIILNNYGGQDNASTAAAWKENFLKTSPITKNLPAVKNDCILALDFEQLTPAPSNADTVEVIARWLHPESFQ